MESQPAKATLRVEQDVTGPNGQKGLTFVFMDIEGVEGRPYEFDVVRLPADKSIRASTPRGTLTPFRISHKIELGYLYSHRGDRTDGGSGLTPTTPKRRFNIKRAVHLAPCVRLTAVIQPHAAVLPARQCHIADLRSSRTVIQQEDGGALRLSSGHARCRCARSLSRALLIRSQLPSKARSTLC